LESDGAETRDYRRPAKNRTFAARDATQRQEIREEIKIQAGRGIVEKARPHAIADERAHADFRVKRFDELGDFHGFAHVVRRRRDDHFVLRQEAIFIVLDLGQQPLIIAARDVAGDDQRPGGFDVLARERVVIHIEKLGTDRRHVDGQRQNDAQHESSNHWPLIQVVGPGGHLTFNDNCFKRIA
jgi:hypothetical protein